MILPPKEATEMSRDIKYIGMDVHQEAIVIAVLNGSGKVVMESARQRNSNDLERSRWHVSQSFRCSAVGTAGERQGEKLWVRRCSSSASRHSNTLRGKIQGVVHHRFLTWCCVASDTRSYRTRPTGYILVILHAGLPPAG